MKMSKRKSLIESFFKNWLKNSIFEALQLCIKYLKEKSLIKKIF